MSVRVSPCAWWLLTLSCMQVTMYLNSPEIVVQPSVNDLKKVLGRLARNQVESSKPFVRWMSGTCIETPEVRGASEDDEPFVHTFFTDVSQNPQIVKTMLNLTQSTQKVIFGITRSAASCICFMYLLHMLPIACAARIHAGDNHVQSICLGCMTLKAP